MGGDSDSSRKTLSLSMNGLGRFRTGSRLMGHIRSSRENGHRQPVRTDRVIGTEGDRGGAAECGSVLHSDWYSERRMHSPSTRLTSQSAPRMRIYISVQYPNITLDAYLLAAFQHRAFALRLPPKLLKVSLDNHQPGSHQFFWTESESFQLLPFPASFQ